VYFSFQSSRSVIDFWSIAFCYSDDQQVLLLLRDCLLEASDNDLLNHFRVSSTIPFSLVDRLILIYKDYDNVRERLFYLKGVYDECDSVEAFPYVKPGFCSEAAQDNDITTSWIDKEQPSQLITYKADPELPKQSCAGFAE